MLFDLDGFFLPKYCRKEYILNPEEYDKKRDYLLNLYFGQPDNEEPLAKLGYTTYFCAKFGLALGMLRIASMKSNNPPLSRKIFAKTLGYTFVYGLTYNTITTAVANIRKDDSILNHVIGGASTGFIEAYRSGSSARGSIVGVIGAIVAGGLKYFHDNDCEYFNPDMELDQERNLMYGSSKYNDITIPFLFKAKEQHDRLEHYKL